MIPAHGVTTILYLLEKARGAAFARDGVERLIRVNCRQYLAAVMLIGCKAGSSSADRSSLIFRGCRGTRLISPRRSSATIMS